MEFKVPNKAKMLTIALMIIGVVFMGLGILMHVNDHHFGTRFLVSWLTSSFFYFSIGLGALFFLALQYATETGWYAVVKRVIEAVAGSFSDFMQSRCD